MADEEYPDCSPNHAIDFNGGQEAIQANPGVGRRIGVTVQNRGIDLVLVTRVDDSHLQPIVSCRVLAGAYIIPDLENSAADIGWKGDILIEPVVIVVTSSKPGCIISTVRPQRKRRARKNDAIRGKFCPASAIAFEIGVDQIFRFNDMRCIMIYLQCVGGGVQQP